MKERPKQVFVASNGRESFPNSLVASVFSHVHLDLPMPAGPMCLDCPARPAPARVGPARRNTHGLKDKARPLALAKCALVEVAVVVPRVMSPAREAGDASHSSLPPRLCGVCGAAPRSAWPLRSSRRSECALRRLSVAKQAAEDQGRQKFHKH
jgi:hypothetical protein